MDIGRPLPYLARIRSYYLALGYEHPYQWAHFDEVPFSHLEKPLSRARIGLVTTAALFCKECGDQGPGAAYNAAAKFYNVYASPTEGNPNVYISHLGYDRKHTTAKDQNTWFPLTQLKLAAASGRIGAVSRRFYGLPTNRSQTTTLERDAPKLLERFLEDDVNAAVLVANCPVCHQCCCLAARHLEQNGIATVVLGCAKDIVEHIGIPRFMFSDFPLGNAAGKPGDVNSQCQTLDLALTMLDTATAPRTTLDSPIQWSESENWKNDFYNIERLSEQERRSLREKFDQDKAIAKKKKQTEGRANPR